MATKKRRTKAGERKLPLTRSATSQGLPLRKFKKAASFIDAALQVERGKGSEILFDLDQPFQRVGEITKCGHWQHDRVATAPDIFGNLQETTTVIFLQIEKKHLSINRDFLRSQGFVDWAMVSRMMFYHKL